MSTMEQPQLATDEKVLESTALEAALETRESKKKAHGATRKAFKEADDVVKGLLGEFELADGEVARIGAYRIEKKKTLAGHREFDVGEGSRLIIKRDQDPESE